MIDQVLSASSYSLNFFAFPPLIASLATILLGISVLIHERLSRLSITFFILTITIFLWLFSVFWLFSSTSETVANFWINIVYCGVCFIPAANFQHSRNMAEILKKNFLSVSFCWITSAFFLFLVFSTDLFINGTYHFQWGYYAKFGKLGALFLFYFFSVSLGSFLLFIDKYKKTAANTISKKRLKNSILAVLMANLGAIDFMGSYGLTVYPIGYLPILLTIIIITYTIWQYSFGYITPAFAAEEIIATMKDALLVLDNKGNIRVMNQSAAGLFSDGRVLNGEFFKNLTPDRVFVAQICTLLRKNRSNIASYEIAFQPITGDEKILSLTASAIYDQHQQLTASVCIFRDITELKRAEEELIRHRDNLEKIIELRTNNLEETNIQLLQEITERKRIEKKLTSSREELRNLSAYLQDIREEERTNIAREIHDELGQILTALHFDVSWLQKRLNRDQNLLFEKTRSMARHIESSINSVHKIITELRPGVLDHLSLSDAIDWQINDFMTRTGIQCNLKVTPRDIDLADQLSTTIFRILQETLTNVIRHSQATEVRLHLHKTSNTVRLTVQDNGKGITKKTVHNPDSFGIIGIRERVNMLNGQFRITGTQGKGTMVTVVIPILEKLQVPVDTP